MKNRLTKSIQRLKKEKKISDKENSNSKILTAYNVKIFRNLSDKYDLSLTINKEKLNKENDKEQNLSLGAQMTLERIKKGENFKL
tara:strand:- start:367 stop:621 length:255 start_codon:yes stop_codon:yes gene_type:complete